MTFYFQENQVALARHFWERHFCSMGNLPMAVVSHGIDRYSGQLNKSEAIFLNGSPEERFAFS